MSSLEKLYRHSISTIQSQLEASPFENPAFYSTWLSQCYYFVKHSTRLLALAAAKTPFDHPFLHRRMIKHISEEQGHENLALKDISHLPGKTLTEELSATRYFYQMQYSLLLQESSPAFMGYILFLEGLAVEAGENLLARLNKAHSEKATLFVKVHAEEDVGHIHSAFDQLSAFSEIEIRKIEQNLIDSAFGYQNLLSQCQSESLKTNRRENFNFDESLFQTL